MKIKNKVKLDDVIEMLDCISMEQNAYYNSDKNELFCSDIGDYTDLNADELDELFDTSIVLPSKYEINEYGTMKEFIEKLEDIEIHNQLSAAIKGRGAFRRFKDACINYN